MTNVFQNIFFVFLYFEIVFGIFLYFVIFWYFSVFAEFIGDLIFSFWIPVQPLLNPSPGNNHAREGQLMLTQWQNLVVCTSLPSDALAMV